jgi:hypothetical protein
MNTEMQRGLQPLTVNPSPHNPIAEESITKGPPVKDLTRPSIQTQKQMQMQLQTQMQMQIKTLTSVEWTVNLTIKLTARPTGVPLVSQKRTRFINL